MYLAYVPIMQPIAHKDFTRDARALISRVSPIALIVDTVLPKVQALGYTRAEASTLKHRSVVGSKGAHPLKRHLTLRVTDDDIRVIARAERVKVSAIIGVELSLRERHDLGVIGMLYFTH